MPSGLSTLWSGPATKPSSDMEILKRSLGIGDAFRWGRIDYSANRSGGSGIDMVRTVARTSAEGFPE
jgi:hypothetical protein